MEYNRKSSVEGAFQTKPQALVENPDKMRE